MQRVVSIVNEKLSTGFLFEHRSSLFEKGADGLGTTFDTL